MTKDYFSIYNKHYERISTIPNYQDIRANPERHKLQEAWLPEKLDAKILDIGCGWGTLLLSLWTNGYRNLIGVDISKSMYEVARRVLPDEITIVSADGLEFLKNVKYQYDLITIFDFIEHMTVDRAYELLKECHEKLAPKGSVVIKTGNMINIFSASARYIDITHQQGYTEWSLFQLLDNAGFQHHRVIKSKIFSYDNWKRHRTLFRPWCGLGLRKLLNTIVHKVLFALQGQNLSPSTYSINLIVQSWKE